MSHQDEIDAIRRAARAELDVSMDRWIGEAERLDAAVCQGCFRRWRRTREGTYLPPPVWIRQAHGMWHWRCYQLHKQGDL